MRGQSYLDLHAVSIHAPARGRQRRPNLSQQPQSFNPRPRAGATDEGGHANTHGQFQSTPPRGGDLNACFALGHVMVSIHAPARGRPRLPPAEAVHFCFNPRPRAGATHFVGPAHVHHRFQSTPPRGGDFSQANGNPLYLVSIHAPARGRPRRAPFHRHRLAVSIHAPARGRLSSPIFLFILYRFQSTPPRGGDHFVNGRLHLREVSIHAPARGRPRRKAGPPQVKSFNPRPRAGATHNITEHCHA